MNILHLEKRVDSVEHRLIMVETKIDNIADRLDDIETIPPLVKELRKRWHIDPSQRSSILCACLIRQKTCSVCSARPKK